MEKKIEKIETTLSENLHVVVSTAFTKLPALCPQLHLPPVRVDEVSTLLLRASPLLAWWIPSPLATQELCIQSQWSSLRPHVT